ncbi:MAG: tetratricopeptide repeat protein [Gammaproteobacteria bacterium]
MESVNARRVWLVTLLLSVGACGGDPAQNGLPANSASQVDDTGYVGVRVCEGCHADEVEQWQGSHHDLAMQPATSATVLGDFDDQTFAHNGVETSLYVRDGDYFVRTDGPDGALREFPVLYTYGVEPLQQYIVELADGRLQALGVVWDSRPAVDGGQRWFHVYGDEPIDHDDVLHWTKMSQSWDSMCADCHSTGIERSYDIEADRFDTRWAEIDVACESCHGPGREHAEWARAGESSADMGLNVRLNERRDVGWIMNPETGNSRRSEPRRTGIEIGVCAPCHSRRSRIAEAPLPGDEFLDGYMPALPQPPLYHADGQILDEVYVYGSFLQSRMYQQGVTCSDCHEPHSLQLRAPGSQVCLQCHLDERFATADHQLLGPGADDVVCVDCHMPATTYMQVDARRDHSFRIPRPDLSAAHGTPNACDSCHADRPANWAADTLREIGRGAEPGNHWVDSLVAVHTAPWDSRNELLELATNALAPAIIRATAITSLSTGGDPVSMELLAERADSSDPMIRWAVARSLQQSHPAIAANAGPKLLRDPVRAVRLEAVSALAPLGLELLPQEVIPDLQSGIEEYIGAQLLNAERAEAHVNVGNLLTGLRRYDEAEESYRTALAVNPLFVPAYVNLADLLRGLGRDDEGESLLRSALERIPADSQSGLRHSLGLTMVRLGDLPAAVRQLGMAANSPDADPQYVLAYALALDAQGEQEAAAEVLEGSLERFGAYPQLVAALVNVYQRMGNEQAASALAARMRNR